MNIRNAVAALKEPVLTSTSVMNQEIRDMINRLGPDARILNIGSSRTRYADNVINLDIVKLPGVDVVGDAHNLPFGNDTFDGVIITAVLEIVERPPVVVSEINRVLKKGGVVLATVPFLQPYHPDPTDYQRFTIAGVERLFSAFEKVKLRNTRGAVTMFSWILRDFLALVLSFNNLRLWKFFRIFFGWLLSPLKYLEPLLPDYQWQYFLSSSFLYIGRKTV